MTQDQNKGQYVNNPGSRGPINRGQDEQGKTRSGETAGDRDVTGNPAEGYQNSLVATKDQMEGDDARGIARGD